jgi:hypothetical protein
VSVVSPVLRAQGLVGTYCAACGQLKLSRERCRGKAEYSRSNRTNHGDDDAGVLHDADGNDVWSNSCYSVFGLD